MKGISRTLVAAVLALAMASACVLAAEKAPKAPKKYGSTVSGTLAIVKEADGKVSATTVTTKSGTVYHLAGLTQNVTSLDGKDVIVKGEVTEEDGAMTLQVQGRIMTGELKARPEKKAGKNGQKNKKQQ